jgi:anaerobic magnesium-protoporphyrin IX monomethyl ester cyclase
MGRIAFIQHSLSENLGVMSISSVLKKHGHECDVFCLSGEDDFYKSLFGFKPDVVACSMAMGEQKKALEMLRKIKELDKGMKTFVGGSYVLVFPEIIKEDCVDLMCVGDGEYACLEVMTRLDKDKELFGIPGIRVKTDGHIHENSDIAYVADITELPILDRDLYYQKYDRLRYASTKPFILSRGCPFKCSYCYTHWINRFYTERAGAHFRLDSPEKVMSEIAYVRGRYGLEWIRFQDGTFNADLKFIKKFLKLYGERTLPRFIANARVENINEELVSLLKQAGCDKIVLGIQSGDETLRKVLTGRSMSNEQIIEACKLLKRYRIRVGVDIIFGWPGEALQSAYETINLCREIRPDDINSNVLCPYPKTQIADYCVQNGYLAETSSYKTIEPLQSSRSLTVTQGNIKQLINLDKLGWLAVRVPFIQRLVNVLIKLPPNKLFKLVKDIPAIRRNFKYDIKTFKERITYLRRYFRGLVAG